MRTYLVVDVVEDVAPKNIQLGGLDKEASDAHPETIGESRDSQSNNEYWERGGDQDDKGFCGEKIEEQPHDPREECLAAWLEVGEPVGNDREENSDDD